MRKEGDKSFDASQTAVGSDCTSYEKTNNTSLRVLHSQSDLSFSEYSRESQCLAHSLMFLARLQETDEVVRGNLDDVIRNGDVLYHRMRPRLEENERFTSRLFNFDDLPDTVETDQCHYTVMRSIPSSGFLLQDAPEGWEDYVNLSLRLEGLGTAYSQALLIVGSLCISVFQDRHGQFGFFHPHSQNASGACCGRNEKAVVVTSDTVTDLANQLVQFFYSSLHLDADKQYNLLPVFFNKVTSEDHIKAVSAIESKRKSVPHRSSQPKVSLKLDKFRRKRVARRLRRLQMQQALNEKKERGELEGAQHIRDAEGEGYLLHPSEKMTASTAQYWNDPAGRQRKKRSCRNQYRDNPTFQETKKQRIRERYWLDPVFKERQKQRMRDRYWNDPVYRQKQKQRVRECYRTDPAFRLRHKEYARLRNQFKATENVSDQIINGHSNTEECH